MNWIQKPWGYTACQFEGEHFEFWQCYVIAGGFSSLHRHASKHNRIYCRTATLQIDLPDMPQRMVIVHPGKLIDIEPGIRHRFRVLKSGSAWESYWGDCHPSDIIRNDQNGWSPIHSETGCSNV